MATNLNEKLDSCWKAARRAPPRSKRRLKLESELVTIQLKRLRQEIKAGKYERAART